MADFKALVAKAEAAGMAALVAAKPTPMVITEADIFGRPKPGAQRYYESEGPCGFAWIHFAGNTEFGRWAKKNDVARADYPKGLCVWVSEGGQSVERKEAYARAYAAVLKEAGIDCYANSRLD